MSAFLYKSIGLGLNLLSLVAPRMAARRAYELFCTPVRPHVRPKEQAFLATAKQIQSQIAGHDIVEYHWGPVDGPLLLLTYGWSYNAGRWRHFVPALEEAGFHVLAYDPPGHGLNPKGLLNVLMNSQIQTGLIQKYGPVQAILGHSFGGAASVMTMHGLPPSERPQKAVIMASFSRATRVFGEYQRALGLWDNVYYGMIRYAEAKVGLPLHHFDFAPMASQLSSTKALIVHAPEDPVTAFANAERYHNYWPGSRLLKVAGRDHHLGKAQVTADIIQFLLSGQWPAEAEASTYPVKADHELVRYFGGVEIP